MREWIGDRQITNLKSQKLDVKNRSFEKTVAVKRDDIEDDKYGLYNPLVQDLGQSAGELWADLATEILLSAKNAIWDRRQEVLCRGSEILGRQEILDHQQPGDRGALPRGVQGGARRDVQVQ